MSLVPVGSFSFLHHTFLRIRAIFLVPIQPIQSFRLAGILLSALLLLILRVQAGPQSRQPNTSQFKSLSEQAAIASSENRLDEAAALYAKTLALRPRWTDGWWSLGTIEYDRDHYAKAAHAFEKVIALDSKNGTAHAMLGLCQFELHQDDAALKKPARCGTSASSRTSNCVLWRSTTWDCWSCVPGTTARPGKASGNWPRITSGARN